MSPAYQIGIVTFQGAAEAERLVSSLRDRGAVGTTNEVGIVEHHASGRFSVHAYSAQHTRGHNVGEGAVIGSLAGALLLGPFGLLAGLLGGGLVGATAGGAKAHDLELSDEFTQSIKAALPEHSSAVVVVGDAETIDQLIGEIKTTGVVTKGEFHHPLTDEQVGAVRTALEHGGS